MSGKVFGGVKSWGVRFEFGDTWRQGQGCVCVLDAPTSIISFAGGDASSVHQALEGET